MNESLLPFFCSFDAKLHIQQDLHLTGEQPLVILAKSISNVLTENVE